MREENDKDPYVVAPMHEEDKINPVELSSALHAAYDRSELLRLPPHIIAHVYGKVAASATTSVTKQETLIDVTGWQEGQKEENCEENGEEKDDADCVVYLGTKQPTDEDDLDGWLDSVIS